MPRAYAFTEFGGPEHQEWIEIDQPTPLPADVLVEVRAAGVNPVDWKVREGQAPGDAPSLPAVLGVEVSGVAREVGQDVDGIAVGDEVFGYVAVNSGGYAEYTLINGAETAKKPPQVSWTDAATLSVAAATAYDGVTQLDLKPGQTLLINGVGGGVGVAAAQIARDLGIAVIGTASEDKRPLVEQLGAILIPYGNGVADRIREIQPNGVDAIFDLAGGDGLRAVAGLLSDRSKLISAGDFSVGDLGGHVMERAHSKDVLQTVAAMVAEGKLDPHVEDVWSFDQAADALAAVEIGHAKGKVVIQVS